MDTFFFPSGKYDGYVSSFLQEKMMDTFLVSSRFLNPQLVTKVSPSDDIEGINNFDIFVIQVFRAGIW